MPRVAEVRRRLRALKDKGVDAPLIGRKPRPLSVQRRLALGRFIHRLILNHRGHQVVISLTKGPELCGDHVSLSLALRVPLARKGLSLSSSERERLEDFLESAIEEGSLLVRSKSSRSTASTRPAPRRASVGI